MMDKPYEFCTYCGNSDWEGACCGNCGMPSVTERIEELERQKKAMWDSHWKADQQNQKRIAELEARLDAAYKEVEIQCRKVAEQEARLDAVNTILNAAWQERWTAEELRDHLQVALEQKDAVGTNSKD